ncbi:MAG: hypothetical protein BGN88_02660 [Clostridiales bacterium 43-6]|nr:MAG: hypothetical protein BGN88_02660 [Clostridiales bacterium 43-6]
MNKKLRKSFYFKPIKIVRDLVHEYVSLTKFDLKIIDTLEFQRLKDVRQLTCQHVYPAARHTRFEHSLGVLELTRKAIKNLNKNGIIVNSTGNVTEPIFDDNLQFNAALAALLHDVGHCPFSHMGEVEFDAENVRKRLYESMKFRLKKKKYHKLRNIIKKANAANIGSVHEQLSCIVILEKLFDILSDLNQEASDGEDSCYIETDFELIIRCILGIEYDVSTDSLFVENKEKNAVVRLINSSIFDMDKLDYIMRDSFFTGIGTPVIDTKRLFRNMYVNDKLSLVFTSKAILALQNMIDARDGLYMYVYNHHAVIFSDFLNAYIARRMSHNAEAFLILENPDITQKIIKDTPDNYDHLFFGLVPKSYLYSASSVVDQYRSDSDWISLLNEIHTYHTRNTQSINKTLFAKITDSSKTEDIETLKQKTDKTFRLIHQLQTRSFLKPWWKTVFEFSNFMHQNFRDDVVRKRVGQFICNDGKFDLDAAEFRSQIAKHVIFITKRLAETGGTDLIEPFEDSEFFVIQRSTRFYAPDTIEKLEIALKSSEITESPIDTNYRKQEYYIKTLTNIIPQKNYSSIYAKEGFYIFSTRISKEKDEQIRKKHYKLIEQIFVFVATELIRRGKQNFIKRFQQPYHEGLSMIQYKKQVTDAEYESMHEIYELFVTLNGL